MILIILFMLLQLSKCGVGMKEIIVPADAETHLMVVEALRSMVYIVAQTTKSVQQYFHGGIQHWSL